MNYSIQREKTIGRIKKLFVCAAAVCTVVLSSGVNAEAVNVKTVSNTTVKTAAAVRKSTGLAAPKLLPVKNFDTDYTHPYNRQTSQITLHWNSVKGASKYQIYVLGGKYKKYTLVKTASGNKATVTGLSRSKAYKFKIRAVSGKKVSDFSKVQTIHTARIDFDAAGWQAMCRIVYHEVGKIDDPMWDKPIVYVSDCVVNRYAQAKYGNHPLWAPFYKNYKSVQDVIYYSGGFMSSAQLTSEGAAYKNVPAKVKKAVLGAVYNVTMYKGIKNDNSVYYWCNRSYKSYGSGIAYQFRIPWGYFNVWRTYWG